MLSSLKTDAASSPNGIPPRFLEFADELVPVFCRLFCLILNACTYPSSWKHALVQPVPKKGDCSNSSNYCPIALALAVVKVFETLLNSHFIKHLESINLLSDHHVWQDLQGIFFPILLISGHSLLLSLKYLTESSIRFS